MLPRVALSTPLLSVNTLCDNHSIDPFEPSWDWMGKVVQVGSMKRLQRSVMHSGVIKFVATVRVLHSVQALAWQNITRTNIACSRFMMSQQPHRDNDQVRHDPFR